MKEHNIKVLIVSTSDAVGGAAVAAQRLLHSLNNSKGVDAKMLVATGQPNEHIKVLTESLGKKLLYKCAFLAERLQIFTHNKWDRSKLFHVSTAGFGLDIHDHPWVKWADVIHFHWINQGFLSLRGIEKIASLHKPIVWTLHDLWPATSICHHPRECERYTLNAPCGICPQINSTKQKDLSGIVASEKIKLYSKLNLHIVGCSEWIMKEAQKSSLLRNASFYNVPNPIDVDLFAPMSRLAARRQLGIREEGFYIMFGAVRADDYRKGIDELAKMLHSLYRSHPEIREDLHLIIFGNMSQEAKDKLPPFDVHYLGYVTDKRLMAKAYNAADLFVTTSLEENLPNTIMEALSCGTPCVGFDVGGIPEMISSEDLGHVSPLKDVENMKDFILQYYFEEKNNYPKNSTEDQSLSIARNCCRCTVLGKYDSPIVAQRYQSIYLESLKC